MRLQSLKLAGFKSFVDPVTFRFPDPLTAIVGPNGCGKSNVIDAIRWVMGESSARQLRGDAMSDVIFAGTSQRKPVGQASVELVFENTLGKLGGAYNHYTELAVRRQVTRDGRSDYFLNGQRCRRRDITDIFLGTGLGARSYAVIQQGMINRLVEAKPDDLRVFIEEAAGVSRYQSRRRETEQHLEHTRLNLSRLQDVAEELASQMRSLKRQSQAAERYRALQTEQQQLQVEIGSLRIQQVSQQQQAYTEQLSEWGEQFRALKTEQQQTEQAERQSSDALTELLTQAEPEQQRWQAAEQALALANTRYAQLEQQQQQVLQQQQQLTQQQAALTEQLQLDHTNLLQLEQQRQQTARALQQLADPEQLRDALNVAEQAWRRWQADEQQQQQQLSRLQQQRQQAEQQQAALEKQQQRASQQIQQLERHQQQLAADSTAAQLAALEQQLDEISSARQQSSQQQQHLEQQHQQHAQALQVAQQQQQTTQQQLAAAQAEYAALQQMQAALSAQTAHTGQGESSSNDLLLNQLQLTAAGQQHAAVLEAMLARWLMAQPECSTSEALQAGQAYYRTDFFHQISVLDDPSVQPIQHWLTAPQLSLWTGVGIVADHATAWRLRDRLQAGQSLLTETGEWVGIDWQLSLRPAASQSTASVQGALTCQLRLTTLQQQISTQQQQLAEQHTQLAEQQAQLTALQQQQRQQAEQQQQLSQQQRQLELSCAGLTSRISSHAQQDAQLHQQLEHLLQAQADDQAELNELYLELAALQLKIEPVQRTVVTLQQQREPLAAQRQHCLNAQHTTEQQRQRLTVEQHTQTTRYELLGQQLQRQQQQLDQLEQPWADVTQQRAQIEQQWPDAVMQRDQAASHADAARQTWQQRQTRLQSIQAEQQQLIQQRHQQQQAEQVLRDQMEQARLAWQACKAELVHLAEQLQQLQREPLSDVSGEIAPREQQLLTVTAQLARLGELNLAAPAALAEVGERHAELVHQMDDLQQAVQQLEQAMQQIDRETRSVFMQTFDQVNAELQVLFPKVFGGGEACLSLADDWQSGVRLMARPPGKKNSNISLLSGGEKALTALALVFAIFRLNPAPFCLLDEVDAPLDDANVARFCHLVQELSAQVQFIFISHNKLAMSMASQLLGVTMPEAGVSRLVAVNLEQAAAFEPLQE